MDTARRDKWSAPGVGAGTVALPRVYKRSRLQYNKSTDDSKLFGRVTCYEECCRLQNDLDSSVDWADTGLMEFNISKCHVMPVGKDNARFT